MKHFIWMMQLFEVMSKKLISVKRVNIRVRIEFAIIIKKACFVALIKKTINRHLKLGKYQIDHTKL